VWFTSVVYFLFFFFSSRRRHTRSKRDWSSDVCSSDLFFCGSPAAGTPSSSKSPAGRARRRTPPAGLLRHTAVQGSAFHSLPHRRSEERRVGKECRSRRSTYQ